MTTKWSPTSTVRMEQTHEAAKAEHRDYEENMEKLKSQFQSSVVFTDTEIAELHHVIHC